MSCNQTRINALNNAIEEITQLRRQNEILSAKVEMIELFRTVLMTRPHQVSVGAGEDVVFKLRRLADELRDEDERKNQNRAVSK